VILVTGASEGIGLACAEALLERTGSPVLITGRSQTKLDRARASIRDPLRHRLGTLRCDQSCASDVTALIDRLQNGEPLEGAILTVGANPTYEQGPRRIHALDRATIESTIRTNCTHSLLLSAAVLDRLRHRRAGSLVWIGSLASRAGLPGSALYCATKSFLSGLARAAHNEYARHDVRVHVVHPGIVRTPRTAAVADAFAARHGLRVAEPSAVAGRVVDLLLADGPAPVEVCL